MNKNRLIATSATVAGIEKMLNEFYASNSYRVNADLSVWHPTMPVSHLLIVKRGKRLRLEIIRNDTTAPAKPYADDPALQAAQDRAYAGLDPKFHAALAKITREGK